MRHFHSFSIALLFSSNVLAQLSPGLLGIPTSSVPVVPVVPSIVSQVGSVVNGVVSVTPTGGDTVNNARQSTPPTGKPGTDQNGAIASTTPRTTNHRLAGIVSSAANGVGSVVTQDLPSVVATLTSPLPSVVHGVQSIGKYCPGTNDQA